MQEITKPEHCTACRACYSICPVNAIEMKEDKEGFLIPVICEDKCINCGLCTKVCPANNPPKFSEKVHKAALAAGVNNDEIRRECSSGGIFAVLAESILKKGGYVCGAAFSDDFKEVKHIIISDIKELFKLQKSKYIQSNLGNVFIEIKKLLEAQKTVLFTGTPCQVGGLVSFLGKSYSNLYTIEIVCHGVPSPGVWKKYITEISNDKEIKFVNFRNKQYGWESPLWLTIEYQDGTVLKENSKTNLYYRGFLKNLILRKCCTECAYTRIQRISDITLGDFWKINKFSKKLNDKKGTSMVLINSEKGQKLFDEIKPLLKFQKEVPIKYAIKGNPLLVRPVKVHKNRQSFFLKYKHNSICKSITDVFEEKYDGIIANFWDSFHNYGAILTGYALQQYFFDRGLDFRLLSLSPQRDMRKKDSFVRKFAEKNLVLTRHIKNKKQLSELNNCADVFVVGSDQVFRDHCIKKYFDEFMLPYTDFSKKRIAFSASFGKDTFDMDENEKYIISKYLKRFDAISVREISGVKLCQDEFGIKAEHILDPVFLVDKSKFTKFVNINNHKYKDKIVCVILDHSEAMQKTLNDLKKESGLEIINIVGKNLPVEEFLTAIFTAKYVISDSFHGTCFALLFHKKFLTIKNEDRGSTRFDSLIHTFGLQKQFVRTLSEIKMENLEQAIDWSSVDYTINKEKENAEIWFEKVFKQTRTNLNEMLSNEFDILKYPKFKQKWNIKKFLFSVEKNQVRTRIWILGIRISIKKDKLMGREISA